MRQTALRIGIVLLTGLIPAVTGCGRKPLGEHGPDAEAVGGGGGAGSFSRGDAAVGGSSGTSGSVDASGDAGTTGGAGTSGGAATGGALSTGGAGGTGGVSIGGKGGGGTAGVIGTGGTGVVDKKGPGQPCTMGSECNSAICADGVCCNQACTGSCRSCAVPGTQGNCVAIAAGARDPHAVCVSEGTITCGATGLCDGAGACQRYPVGTVCGTPRCVESTFTPAPTCDGLGKCVTPSGASCAPYGCNTSASACNRGCPSGDAICDVGFYCAGDESCFPRKDPGAACGSNHECKSGYCVDGACCGAACTGKCLNCTAVGGVANCTALAAGTVCAAQTCSAAVLTQARTCDGAGICRDVAPISCAPYTCRTDAPRCRSDCALPADCVDGYTCMGIVCGLQ